jgi:hypothetical protein
MVALIVLRHAAPKRAAAYRKEPYVVEYFLRPWIGSPHHGQF